MRCLWVLFATFGVVRVLYRTKRVDGRLSVTTRVMLSRLTKTHGFRRLVICTPQAPQLVDLMLISTKSGLTLSLRILLTQTARCSILRIRRMVLGLQWTNLLMVERLEHWSSLLIRRLISLRVSIILSLHLMLFVII